jgi:hypothetical protein
MTLLKFYIYIIFGRNGFVKSAPGFARAKNILGKWVYLVQASDKLRQHVQVIKSPS